MGAAHRTAAALSVALSGLSPATALAGLSTSAPYAVSVVQGGHTFPLRGVIQLRRRPFSLVFKGARSLGYEVVTTSDRSVLTRTSTAAGLAGLFPYGSAAAEGDRDRFLVVNRREPGDEAAPLTFQYWWNTTPTDGPPRFQKVTPGVGGAVSDRRDISEMLLDTGAGNDADIPIERFQLTPIYMVVVIAGATDKHPVRDPTSATLKFVD